MSSSAIRRFGVRCMLGLLSCAAPLLAQNNRAFYISFQVPNSTGIASASINDYFTVAGSYRDTSFVAHGFIRNAFGKLTTFDVPNSVSTNVAGISDDGSVVGSYVDSSNTTHGFIRHPQGTYTTVDVAGSTGTAPASINSFGAITGDYFAVGGGGSFIRSPQGAITTFAPEHAQSINLFGTVVGQVEASSVGISPQLVAGFVRTAKGVISTFEAPGAASGGTYPNGIDAYGDIIGNYFPPGEISRGFVRTVKTGYSDIVPPNAFTTQVAAINQLGDITGFYSVYANGTYTAHGFFRDVKGDITSFDAPGTEGIQVFAINDFDVIVGVTGKTLFLRVPY